MLCNNNKNLKTHFQWNTPDYKYTLVMLLYPKWYLSKSLYMFFADKRSYINVISVMNTHDLYSVIYNSLTRVDNRCENGNALHFLPLTFSIGYIPIT